MEADYVQSKQRPILLVLALFLAVLAFASGTLTGLGINRSRLLTSAARVAQITSGALTPHRDDSIPAVTNLNALEVIWEVREKVKQSFVYPIKDDKKLTYGAIRGMLAALDDPFTRFLEPDEYKEFQTDTDGHFDGIGAVLEAKVDERSGREQVVISSILPEGPASKTELRPGDIVLKVDKTSVEGKDLSEVVKLIRGPRGTPVILTVYRKGVSKPLPITVVRANIEVKVVEYKMIDPQAKIGYLWLRSFNHQAVKETRAAIDDLTKQGMTGLVLDLSMDPGGLLDVAVQIGSFFIADGPIVFIKNRGEEPQPLNAVAGYAISDKIKMVVLIDGGSASASEIVSGALQDTKRAVIVGQHSFGKSKVQTVMELQDQSALFLSTAVYLTPKLRDIGLKDANGVGGVKPDILFPEPDPNGTIKYKEWHDTQVLKSVDILRRNMTQ
jgi:C-terminal peptidase prc